jgi:hypothetical protein
MGGPATVPAAPRNGELPGLHCVCHTVRRAAAEKLPVGRALLPVLCVFDGQERPSYW